MKMFENDDHDWRTPYDFDKITLRQKRELIDMMFSRQFDHIRLLHSGEQELFELTRYKKVYEEKGHHMVFNLKGKLTFYQFANYFASFF